MTPTNRTSEGKNRILGDEEWGVVLNGQKKSDIIYGCSHTVYCLVKDLVKLKVPLNTQHVAWQTILILTCC